MSGATGRTQAFLGFLDSNSDGVGDTYRVDNAVIHISTAVQGTTEAGFVMAYEVGHTMALADCASCTVDTTAMFTGYSPSDPNLPQGPQTCDNLQVKAIAYP